MKKILCVYAHPNPLGSRANRKIAEILFSLPNLTLHSLYEHYPEFYLDVEAEQERLRRHDILLFQHPLYWYSMPPLLKLWVDSVFTYNFAFGPEAQALRGKDFLLSVTTGGDADSYRPGGYHQFPIETFFPPYEQTARLCGMQWRAPLVLHRASQASDEALLAHAHRVRDRALALAEGKA